LNNVQTQKAEGVLIVVSAPSGAGKTSIIRKILDKYPDIIYSVSYTTRLPRPGEVDGKDYHFVTEEDFRGRIARGEFAEWEEYSGCLYGTSLKTIRALLEEGADLILDIETRGAATLKKQHPHGIFVFILPPSMDELTKRLNGRGFGSKEEREERLKRALDEIHEASWYDYIVFNDRLESAIDQLRSIYVAEKHKRERVVKKIEGFLN
jgi:guanylate kinase